MLLEMAIADAYGIAFEFVEDTPDRPNDLARYYQHPTYAALKPGMYTDDTQRAVANANIMFMGQHFNAREYAAEYLRILRDDPRDGYSRRYQKFLEETPDALTFIQTVKRGSANGSLMGVAPLGFLRSPGEVILAAGIQAYTTHAHATMPFASGVALAAHYFIRKIGPKANLEEYLQTHIAELAIPKNKEAGVAQMSARATYHAMLEGLSANTSLAGIIRWAVDHGGDTDSIAAVTVAVASCSREFGYDIPPALFEGLENRAFGRDYLIRKDKALWELYGK